MTHKFWGGHDTACGLDLDHQLVVSAPWMGGRQLRDLAHRWPAVLAAMWCWAGRQDGFCHTGWAGETASTQYWHGAISFGPRWMLQSLSRTCQMHPQLTLARTQDCFHHVGWVAAQAVDGAGRFQVRIRFGVCYSSRQEVRVGGREGNRRSVKLFECAETIYLVNNPAPMQINEDCVIYFNGSYIRLGM